MAPAQPSRLSICLSHADRAPALHDAWDRARALVASFDPEVVVLFGPDHRRAFRAVIPTVAVALAASARGDRGSPSGDYRVPAELARQLATGLVERGIDVAVAYQPALDHGFSLTARDLLGGLAERAIIPVFLNCASPPVVTLSRAAAIGRAVGATLEARPERVLYVGSGGLTHDLPGFYPLDDGIDWAEDERLARNARLNAELHVPGLTFTPDWDRELLAGLSTTETAWLAGMERDLSGRAGNGGHEAATWVAAWAAAHQPLVEQGYQFDDQRGSGTAIAWSAG